MKDSIIQEAVRALALEGIIKTVKDADKAVKVLDAKIEHRFDASIGINWDVISASL